MEYLQRYSSFSVQNGTAEISLPFGKFSSFQSPSSREQLSEIGLQTVSAILFGWLADKPLPLFDGHPNRFILTNGKHPLRQTQSFRWKNNSKKKQTKPAYRRKANINRLSLFFQYRQPLCHSKLV